MKSLSVVAIVVIASWCASCEDVNAQGQRVGVGSPPVVDNAPIVDSATTGANPESVDPVTGIPVGHAAIPEKPPVPKPPVGGREQAVINALPQVAQPGSSNVHLATPGSGIPVTSFPALRQFLEDSQTAHDKMIVDRFLIGVAILFSVIAAALLFSLPPKPREQKE